MATETIIDYGESKVRDALSWIVYPVCVFLPMAWAISIIDADAPEKLLPLALLSLLTTGVLERISPMSKDGSSLTGTLSPT